MNIGKRYFQLQLKRAGKLLPTILLVTLLLTSTVLLILGLLSASEQADSNRQKVPVGIVGETDDSFLGFGIYSLQNLDATRFMIDFYEMTEGEARRQLTSGKLAAYIRIPDGFIQSVTSGENLPITYVTTNGPESLGTALMDELLEVISDMLTETQSSIIGMQQLIRQTGSERPPSESVVAFNLRYFDFILSRSQIYELKELGMSHQLSAQGYYFCGLMLFFLLLWGIGGSPFMMRRDLTMSQVLSAKGLKSTGQVLCEYLPYLFLMLISLLCAAVLLISLGSALGLTIPEWENRGLEGLLFWCVSLLPVIVTVTAMQFLWYELVSGVIGRILLQFVGAVCLGYLSGCFYPLSFFPEQMQALASLLPTGAGLSYAGKSLTSQSAWGELVLMIGYTALFLCLSAAVKSHNLKRS